MFDQRVDQRDKRRGMHVAAGGDLVGVETLIILLARIFERVIFCVIALDDHASFFFAPAGATRDLGQQLKGSLGGAEIRHTKSGVDRYYADQSYVVKVVALGDHLCADHQINVSAGEFVDQLLKLPRRRVVSRSRRETRSFGYISFNSASICSVPSPT